MEIRELTVQDSREAISRVYEESWKHCYRGMVPEAYLSQIPSGQWAGFLDTPGMKTMVLLEQDEVIGTSSYCRSRSADLFDYGEIVSLYLKPEYIGKGYGTSLMNAVLEKLSQLGFERIYLWVLEANTRARTFYEKRGFTCSGICKEEIIYGRKIREVRYDNWVRQEEQKNVSMSELWRKSEI